MLVAVAGMAAAVLLLSFVFITTTVATNNTNTAYAATDTGGKKGSGGGTGTPTSTPTWTITGKYAPIEDPPYLVPFSQAAATVEKTFPDSNITSGERQYLTIKTKSSPPRLPSPGTGSGGVNDNNATTTTPAYIFQLTRTDDKAMYQMTVVVNGTSGQIIPPGEIEELKLAPSGIPFNPYECHYDSKWGVWRGPGCFWMHPPTD